MEAPRVSVVICAYTEARWDELVGAVRSAREQTVPPLEVIVVIDHNDRLLRRARSYLSGVRIVNNEEPTGLSGARNAGIAVARGEIVAFLDDDAAAAPDWLEMLLAGYRDSRVLGVGGAIRSEWVDSRPGWFPEEFEWVVGCTYRGMPSTSTPVRNLIGANMSFRREVPEVAGGFSYSIGRVAPSLIGCEDTEFCIRAVQNTPGGIMMYEPRALVHHRVPAARATWSYFRSRCFTEGQAKARVAAMVGARDGLAAEQRHAALVLPLGVLRGLRDTIVRRDVAGLERSAAIVCGFAFAAAGYLTEAFLGVRALRAINRNGNNSSGSDLGSTEARGLRLLFVTPRYLPYSGGTETHVHEVAVRLARAGVSVTVLTVDPTGALPTEETAEGISIKRVRAWPADRDYYLAPGIYSAITHGSWDLVHIQSFHTLVAPLAMLAAIRARIPYVLTFHSGGHSSRLRNAVRGAQRRALGPLLRRAERLVAVARFEQELFVRQLGVSRERISLIPNGSDLLQGSPVKKESAPSDGPIIVSVGRLERYKGHHRVIAALPGVLQQRPNARLLILGAGPYRSDLVQLSHQLGVADRVEIRSIPPGERGAMAAALSQAAVVVCMSEYETHPVAVMEALALQRPVLVADTSGLSELAERGWTATVPLDSHPEELAAAIVDQLRQPIVPARIAFPSWDDCAEALLSLYNTTIARVAQCAS